MQTALPSASAEVVSTLAPLFASESAGDGSVLAALQFLYGQALYALGEQAAARQWVKRSLGEHRRIMGSQANEITPQETWLAEHEAPQ